MNADGRTALHIACCEGDVQVVRHLLQMGAIVHAKDRFNRTPLIDAIEYDHHEVFHDAFYHTIRNGHKFLILR